MQETTVNETERPSGRHPVSIGHLVMGLAFVGLVGVWALVQGEVVDGSDVRWLLPIPWVVAGIAGLVATTLTSRNRWATRQTGWMVPAPAPQQADARRESAEPVDTDPEEPGPEEPGPEDPGPEDPGPEDPGTDPSREIR